MCASLIPRLQDTIWEWGYSSTPCCVWYIGWVVFTIHSLIWLDDDAPWLGTMHIIAVPFSLQKWLILRMHYNMAFVIRCIEVNLWHWHSQRNSFSVCSCGKMKHLHSSRKLDHEIILFKPSRLGDKLANLKTANTSGYKFSEWSDWTVNCIPYSTSLCPSSGSGSGSGHLPFSPTPYQDPTNIMITSRGPRLLLYFYTDVGLHDLGFNLSYWWAETV